MAAFLAINRRRSRPEPEVVIESVRPRHVLERPALKTGGHKHLDFLEFADAAVAGEFARQPEMFAAARLGAGLEPDLVFPHGLVHEPAFIKRAAGDWE